MKRLVYIMVAALSGCYGWEYPKLSEIRLVETAPAVAKLQIEDLEGQKGEQYVGRVIEIEGRIGHITNKGGRPGVSLLAKKDGLGMMLSFGPDERQPLKSLIKGQHAVFRGLLKTAPRYGHVGMLEPAVVVR